MAPFTPAENLNGGIGKDKLRETVGDRTRKTVNGVKRVTTIAGGVPMFRRGLK